MVKFEPIQTFSNVAFSRREREKLVSRSFCDAPPIGGTSHSYAFFRRFITKEDNLLFDVLDNMVVSQFIGYLFVKPVIVQGFHIIFSRKEENVPKLFSTKYAIFFIIGSLQGDPNQNPFFQMAVSLKLCNSDPILVKPKCV